MIEEKMLGPVEGFGSGLVLDVLKMSGAHRIYRVASGDEGEREKHLP